MRSALTAIALLYLLGACQSVATGRPYDVPDDVWNDAVASCKKKQGTSPLFRLRTQTSKQFGKTDFFIIRNGRAYWGRCVPSK